MIGIVELVVAIVLAWTVALIVLLAGAFYIGGKLARIRRRRQMRDGWRALSDEEIADSSRPFTDPMYVWPSVAPRNGKAHEHTEG